MSIPSTVLESWSNQGAIETPKLLREKIERKLTGSESKIQQKNQLAIYLQGSYRNNTNIHGNSDVDIVVQSNGTFFSDVSELDTNEIAIYERAFSKGSYTWSEFKDEIIETLQDAFGINNVKIGNKSIEIDAGNYEADVIPCFEYRKYITFGESDQEREYIPGIKFFTTNGNRSVINYPKEHYARGAAKNKLVYKKYKPTIRIFKNLKRNLIEKEMITKDQAPSYFVENLLYNINDDCYHSSCISTRVFTILEWLHDNRKSMSQFMCQNGQLPLFGQNQNQWNEEDANKFINQAIKLWNEW